MHTNKKIFIKSLNLQRMKVDYALYPLTHNIPASGKEESKAQRGEATCPSCAAARKKEARLRSGAPCSPTLHLLFWHVKSARYHGDLPITCSSNSPAKNICSIGIFPEHLFIVFRDAVQGLGKALGPLITAHGGTIVNKLKNRTSDSGATSRNK